MFYTDIVLIAIASLLAFYYAAGNILKKFRFGINRLYSLFCLVLIVFFASLLLLILQPASAHVNATFRIFISLGLLLVQLAFHLAQAYPRWERKLPVWLITLSFLPGLAVVAVTIFTDFIVENVTPGDVTGVVYGPYATAYLSVLCLYLAGLAAVVLYKTRILENVSFRGQLYYLLAGYALCVAVTAFAVYVLPSHFDIAQYRRTGLVATLLAFSSIMNYAVYQDRALDFRKYYQVKISWAIVLLFLALPTYYLIEYSAVLARSGNPIPVVGVAFLLFIYLFTFYRFGKPALERLFRRGAISFEQKVNEFFKDMSDISTEGEQARFLDIFFERSIYPLETRFDIASASFLIANPQDGTFSYSFGFGEKLGIGDAAKQAEVAGCLKEYGNVVEISYFFTEERLGVYRESVYRTMKENDVAVAIPFFNLEKAMIGILLLGGLKNGKPYFIDLLNALEVYRIQFELSLANALMLEDVKKTQVVEHDKLVLGSIKKKIIPRELDTIEGVRLSTFYMDNSEFGGDYFDSVVLGPEKAGVFICDTSDAGIESGLLSLEIYSVLHNHPGKFDTPDKMLNAMNWVVSTSRFSDKYVQAFYLIFDRKQNEIHYSSAAFNPCVLYDTGKDVFAELDTKGIPLGIDKNFIYEFRSVKVQPGSWGFMYSDGLTLAVNSEGAGFSPGRIRDIIRLNHADTPAVLNRKVYNDFTAFSKTAALKNDVSLILFKTY